MKRGQKAKSRYPGFLDQESRRTATCMVLGCKICPPQKKTQPGFAAVVQRHLHSTQVRVIQDLDTVLTFTMSIQAEVGAFILEFQPKQLMYPIMPNSLKRTTLEIVVNTVVPKLVHPLRKREQVSNLARAHSAGVDDHDLSFGDALLDSSR
eukprot:475660-Amphidinium_carterae.1